MGTGKTQLLIRKIFSLIERAAHILPTVSTVNDSAQELGLSHYKNVDEVDAHFTSQMTSTAQSLAADRFTADGHSWFEDLDVLCLDEASQIFRQLTQIGKDTRKIKNYEVLKRAIQSAGSVLITDADSNEHD